jgi:ribonuclease P protein component
MSKDALAIQNLTKRSQFLFVREGLRAGRPTLSIEARRRVPEGPVGVGFTASKRVGGAVARNRAKRRLKEAARRLLPGLAVAGVDYVLVARPAIVDAPWEGLLDDVRNALIRLRADLAAGGREGPRKRREKPTESD